MSTQAERTDFERVGGEAGLRAVIHDFIGEIYGDPMIGFFFRRVNRARLEEMEYQHAAAHLGGPVVYEGRGMREAHRAHRVMGGHFERRKKILSDVLERHGVDGGVRARWLAHLETLRHEVTDQPGSECS